MWNWWNGGQGYVTSNNNRGSRKNVKQTYRFKGNFVVNAVGLNQKGRFLNRARKTVFQPLLPLIVVHSLVN